MTAMTLPRIDTTTRYTAICPACSGSHETISPFRDPDPGELLSRLCSPCDQKRLEDQKAEEHRRKVAARLDTWNATCPARYRNFDPARFTGNVAKLSEAMRWEFGSKGLVLHGHTGQGKTWAAFRLAEREFMENGRNVKVINGNRLRELAGMAYESSRQYNGELKSLISSKLLLINDPFKAKITDKIEEALWDIIDERYEWKRPIILTMNGVAANVEPLLSPDRGRAMFRRLREDNIAIHFPKPLEDQ